MSRYIPPKGRPDARRREPLWDRVDRARVMLGVYLVVFAALGAIGFAPILLVASALLGWIGLELDVSVLLLPLWLLVGDSFGWGTAARVWAVSVVVANLYEMSALRRSEKVLLARFGAVLVPKGEQLDTKMALKDMAIAAGFEVAPALHMMATPNVNAFIIAAPGRRPVVGVTSGFIERLGVDQRRAVFANLMARLAYGQTMPATVISSLMTPLQVWRDRRNERINRAMDYELATGGGMAGEEPGVDVAAAALFGTIFVPLYIAFAPAMIIVAEIVAAGQRRAQLRAAEKADAEGMLLLKDPKSMLAALERCVELNNYVAEAGEIHSELFYCWTGNSTDDADDPEWERVARLREVLGVEGWVGLEQEEPPLDGVFAPAPPRLD